MHLHPALARRFSKNGAGTYTVGHTSRFSGPTPRFSGPTPFNQALFTKILIGGAAQKDPFLRTTSPEASTEKLHIEPDIG
mmetsp:Transcript_46791/g.83928  ORF Transcript_46791/g.83928 Transcript_46791/m.83928 type:complete len:80 (-) Transcript_46791:494-733(-)